MHIFDVVPTPYRQYTHSTIYHQRLFNWREGIQWSRKADTKVLRELWNIIVGKEYRSAQTELRKKGGVVKWKREVLTDTISKIKQENIFISHFPTGIASIDELICFWKEL